MSSPGPPDDEQQPPQWQQPQWQQPQQGDQPSWQQPQEQPSWQQSQPQWGGQQGGYQPAPQTPGSATAALILGICSLVVCGPICGPLAIIYGSKAKAEINNSNGNLTGGGLATAGIVMGWIAVALTVIAIIAIIAISAGS